MKKAILFFLLFPTVFFAQEAYKTVYLDSLGKEVPKAASSRYRIYKDYSGEGKNYLVETYTQDGKIASIGNYKDKEAQILHGDYTVFHPNGNKRNQKSYLDRQLVGKSFEWFENGKPSSEGEYFGKPTADNNYRMLNAWDENGNQTVRDGNGIHMHNSENFSEQGEYANGYKEGKWSGKNTKSGFSYLENYKDGKLLSGESTDNDGTKYKYANLEVKPEPKKGVEDFYTYISKKFKPTSLAEKNRAKGKIILSFVVEKDGKINDIRIIRGLGYGLDEEAIRVLSSYGNWNPGLQKGRKVRTSFTIPISVDYSK